MLSFLSSSLFLFRLIFLGSRLFPLHALRLVRRNAIQYLRFFSRCAILDGMKVFAISDLHLTGMADKPMDIFGPVWEGHIEKIRRDWVEKVSAEDVVLLGGDTSWGRTSLS